MAIYSKTLYQIRHSVAYSLDDCITAICTSNGTTTTVISTSLIRGDDYYNGWDCHFYLGTHKDTSREVTDFAASSDTLTITPAVTANTDTTDYFELHKRFTTAQYNDAINRAVEMGKDEYLLDKTDETTQLADATYEYNVPSGFRYIGAIYQEDDNDTNTFYDNGLIDSRAWSILGGSTPKIKFHDRYKSIGTADEDKYLRIVGQTIQSTLSNDADTCALPTEFVIQMTRAILLEQMDDEKKANRARLIAENERQRMIVPPVGTSVYEV